MRTIGNHGLVLAGLVLSTTLQPDRWVHVGSSANSHDDYLDSESISRSGDKATVWARRDFVAGQDTAWHEIQFDCSAKTQTILSYIRDDGGTISHNDVRPHRESAPIAPGSVEETIFAIACR